MQQKAFINKSDTLCFQWRSVSLPLSVPFFTFVPQGCLKTITLMLSPFTGKKHQQSAPVNGTEAKHFRPHSSIRSPSNLSLSCLSLWLVANVHYHLNLLLFNFTIPVFLSVRYVLFLLSLSSVILQCLISSLWLHLCLFTLFYKLGSRKDSDAMLQVAVTLLR